MEGSSFGLKERALQQVQFSGKSDMLLETYNPADVDVMVAGVLGEEKMPGDFFGKSQ